MKLLSVLLLGFALMGCGGGKSGQVGQSQSGPPPIDPSGNWTMLATDSNHNTLPLAALFNQVGSTVTANSLSAAGNPNLVAPCVPFSATFSNGTVQNVSQFSGTITAGFGPLSFSGTLNQAGTHFDGTYSGLTSSCAGILSSGTFTGDEVPSTSGNWTGTLQPCSFNSQTGDCPTTGVAEPISFVLTQNDATGNVTGTYQVSGLAPFTSGSVSVAGTDQDILSGFFWQFTMTDGSSRKFIVNGRLDLAKAFSGTVFDSTNTSFYKLVMAH